MKKVVDLTKEAARDAALPPVAPKDSLKEKEASQSMKIVLATLPIPSKDELQGKSQASTTAAFAQSPKKPKGKLVIKMKP